MIRRVMSEMTSWTTRGIVVAPFVLAVGLVAFAPSDDGPTICPFALCTGTACPGCGMTRAAGYLIRGDFTAAMTYHPLVPFVVAQLTVGWVWFIANKLGVVKAPPTRAVTWVLAATSAALLSLWVIRLALGSLPPV